MDELLTTLERSGVILVGYPADIAILVRSKVGYEKGKTRDEALSSALNEISEKIEDVLRTVKQWTILRGLGVDASKTELVLTRRNKLPDFNLSVLDNTRLELNDKAKYLGVILDRQLYSCKL